VKKRKGNREIISAIKDHKRMINTDNNGKANILNSYYLSLFSCDRNIPEIKLANSGEKIRVFRTRLATIGRRKSVG